ncbi:zinc finger matrin-type protein 4 isoform X3 [Rhincodon typus]|uniref:zinc finger matrin-type protein 4 isoform X3 n=1 Tax=Rhincodon typus TaxID=259920 RepID=UPI00202E9A85|nr:zinc finger matrin-type protein 4 isoform X3 [Rhincodon typus]
MLYLYREEKKRYGDDFIPSCLLTPECLHRMAYSVSVKLQHNLCVLPSGYYREAGLQLQMKSAGTVDQNLFTDTYCKVCSAQLISESQRVAHYEGSGDGDVDKNKCCTLCNMSFTSAVVAQSHYQGKIHAKRRRLLLGEEPPFGTEPKQISSRPSPMTNPSRQRRDSDRFCQLCNAWFNNPMMAQQHYDGKKHKKNAARADLLEQLGQTLDPEALRALKRSYTCSLCHVILNSIEQYHAHLQGSKHQTNLKNQL